jgi:hypothetical protein
MSAAILEPGRCRVCGCTAFAPCILEVTSFPGNENTCWWVDADETLCSNPKCLAVVPLSEIEASFEE